jgi:hypothetical protein
VLVVRHPPRRLAGTQTQETDLVREFGLGPYPELVSVREGRERRVQGPNSALAKFKATLCARCNNERSQAFDRAYDEFASYLRSRERHVLASRSIDLRAVYGRRWEQGRDALLRYCVKHIGCRLAENDFEVPSSGRRYLDGGPEPRAEFAIEFEIRADIAAATRSNELPASLWLGDVMITEVDRRGRPQTIESHFGYRWLRMCWGAGSELQGGTRGRFVPRSCRLRVATTSSPARWEAQRARCPAHGRCERG